MSKSKRQYPSRVCPQSGKTFIPTDARQKFANPQFRIDYNNDQRKLKHADVDDFSKRLLLNARGLQKIYERLLIVRQSYCSLDLLIYEGWNQHIFSYQTLNESTGSVILWSLNYGVEYVKNGKAALYLIHKSK